MHWHVAGTLSAGKSWLHHLIQILRTGAAYIVVDGQSFKLTGNGKLLIILLCACPTLKGLPIQMTFQVVRLYSP